MDLRKLFPLHLLLHLLLSTASGMNLFSDQWVDGQETCSTTDCLRVAYEMKRSVDFTQDPCEDFYQFTCGGFLKTENIPDNKLTADEFVPLADSMYEEGKLLLEEPVQEDEWELYKMVKHYYGDCANMYGRNYRKNTPVLELFETLGGWPILGTNNTKPWYELQVELTKAGFNSFNHVMKMGVVPNPIDNTKRLLFMDQPDLGIGRKFLLDTSSKEYEAYASFAKSIAVYFGAPDADADTEKVLAFERQLANLSLSQLDRKIMQMGGLTLEILDQHMSGDGYPTNWTSYIKGITGQDLERDEIFYLLALEFWDPFQQLLLSTDGDVVRNYLFFRAAAYSMQFLDKDADDIWQKFVMDLYGKKERKPVWKQCLQLVGFNSERELGLTLISASLYVHEHFKEDAKLQMDEMSSNLKTALRATIDGAEWMDAETRAGAKAKVDAMTDMIGYPDELLNKTLMEEVYDGLVLERDNSMLLENSLEINKFWNRWRFDRLHQSRRNDFWLDNDDILKILDVNALYKAQANKFIFSAAILRGMFFSPEAPRFVNYGSIGGVIGHEISHGFDDTGRLFDEKGNMRNWWSSESTGEYHRRARCVVEQYSGYRAGQINATVDGVSTQSENIADIMGNLVAYRGYEIWIEGNGGEEPALPGLPFTPRQMFWITLGRKYCQKSTDRQLRRQILTDTHSPMEFRINGALSDSDEFAKDFKCPVGSRMNPEEKCRMW